MPHEDSYEFTQEVPDHSYFFQLPNIIDEMGLDPYEFRIYAHIKRITGEHGKFFQSIKQLSISLNISESKVKESLSNLEKGKNSFDLPLLRKKCRKDANGGDISSVYMILDIWHENMTYFREKKAKRGGGRQKTPGGSPENYKEEPIQEEPKTRSQKDVLENMFYETPPPKKEPGENLPYRKEVKDPIKRWKLTPQQAEAFQWLKEQKIDTDDATLCWWIKTFSFERLMDVYDEAVAQSPRSIGAYMSKLLKKKANVSTQISKINKKVAEEFKEKTSWVSLEILKKYAKLNFANGERLEIFYEMEPEEFLEKLKALRKIS